MFYFLKRLLKCFSLFRGIIFIRGITKGRRRLKWKQRETLVELKNYRNKVEMNNSRRFFISIIKRS